MVRLRGLLRVLLLGGVVPLSGGCWAGIVVLMWPGLVETRVLPLSSTLSALSVGGVRRGGIVVGLPLRSVIMVGLVVGRGRGVPSSSASGGCGVARLLLIIVGLIFCVGALLIGWHLPSASGDKLLSFPLVKVLRLSDHAGYSDLHPDHLGLRLPDELPMRLVNLSLVGLRRNVNIHCGA